MSYNAQFLSHGDEFVAVGDEESNTEALGAFAVDADVLHQRTSFQQCLNFAQ